MKFNGRSKNYIFRKFTCGLSVKGTANLCFKKTSDIKSWDEGTEIPDVYKRLMRMNSGQELSHLEEWEGFKICKGKLELPTGKLVSPQELLTAVALLEIGSELELKTSTKLLRLARQIAKIKKN
ncbi:hypothetical protein [Vibrio sinaloensis]|uniref:hypothetical protein n=1 Tax=Photobacterium sp. (strain ATCC 43367) TaxID=379097 RepID=UPI00057F982F|nr:hypothetical protein [Vibrio sinaloensis]KHT38042.1 regulator [Vibrio sinaloensis]